MGNEDLGIITNRRPGRNGTVGVLVEELGNLGAYNIKLMDEEGLRQMVMENGPRPG